jgi:hypothetical protein
MAHRLIKAEIQPSERRRRMFWKKNSQETQEKGMPPKSIPEAVGRYLVVNLNQNPDWVWNLKAVLRSKEDKDYFDVRIFDPSQAASRKVPVKDYNSLNDHPEIVLYEGSFNKKTFEVKIDPKPKAA